MGGLIMKTLSWMHIYGFFTFVPGILSLGIAVYLSPYWQNKRARILMLLMAAIALWSITYGMEVISPTLEMKIWWMKTEYFGVTWICMLLFCFICAMLDDKPKIAPMGYLLLSLCPLAVIFLVLTNDGHHLMWQSVWLNKDSIMPALFYSRAAGFWVYTGFSYLMILLSTVILIRALILSKGILRRQMSMLLLGIMCPWLSNIIYLFGIDALKHFDFTPAAFTVSGITFSLALLKYQMPGLIPLARETLIESMGDPVFVLDINDRILDMNQTAQRIFRIESMLSANLRIRESYPAFFEAANRYRDTDWVDTEIQIPMAARLVSWSLRIFPLKDKKGNRIGRLIVLRDITDSKNTLAALDESEKIHRIILEASPNPIVFYNETGSVTYLNPAFTRVFGWQPEELIGRKMDFVPEENMAETREAIKKTLDNPEGNYNFLTRRYTKAGEILDVSINSALYRSKDGNTKNMVVNFTDITSIKKTEYELRSTKDFIRSIVNSMPSVLIGLDQDALVTQWNKEAERLTGILSGVAEGCMLEEVFPELFIHIPDIRKTIQDQKTRKETRISLSLKEKSVLTDITIYPILSEAAKAVVIRVDDISDRVRLEEIMIQSEKMMSVGGLAAGMAHEINNPLAGMLQNIQVIQNRLEKNIPANIQAAKECGLSFDAIKGYMEKRSIFYMMDLVTASGFRAAQIVENMLSFSRKSDHRKSDCHLNDIMESTLELISNDYSMKKQYDFRSIEIVRQYEKEVPAVVCDKNQIQQVLLNILKNGAEAMVASNTGSPRFIIRIFKEKDHVVLDIEDNGPGISSEIQTRVFEPFFTTKEVGAGTGLGLSVSYFIITENHKGVLSVASGPDKGSIFTIKLPSQSLNPN